jgi:ubiquinone/menaquinone biosynthesis C-methylase UbiE
MSRSPDPKERFTNRVDHYVKYRPSYPRAVLDLLESECGLTRSSVVADVGSGTGILSELFLENGNHIFGIEPNSEMREACERRLGEHPRFTSVAGAAEATTLDDHSVDFVTAGQAFHWFDPERARAEFARILKPGGWVTLIWNWRRKDTTPFLASYERLLEAYRTDRGEAEIWRRGDEMAASFFESFEKATFDNEQLLDLDGFKGRLLSISYVPALGEPGTEDMLREVEKIFDEHQSDGRISVEYETKVYYGRLENQPGG